VRVTDAKGTRLFNGKFSKSEKIKECSVKIRAGSKLHVTVRSTSKGGGSVELKNCVITQESDVGKVRERIFRL
jgi:hypothetical protein